MEFAFTDEQEIANHQTVFHGGRRNRERFHKQPSDEGGGYNGEQNGVEPLADGRLLGFGRFAVGSGLYFGHVYK